MVTAEIPLMSREACQPSRGTETAMEGQESTNDLVYGKLKWGVVESSVDVDSDVGHATFVSENVASLVVGKLYA